MKKELKRVTLETSPTKVLETIARLRERKYKGEESLQVIEKAIEVTHDYIVNLYFERAHIFQLIYMTERDKLGKGNGARMQEGLRKMELYTKETEKYIMANNLSRWLSRLYRFFGKISEYKKEYKKAVEYYRKSLKYWKTDPEVVRTGVPRNFELEGFLSSALIMSGEPEKGLKLARKVYKKYESTDEGRRLKRTDYTTWAIWRTGVVIYATKGLLEGKVKIEKEEVLEWLAKAEKFLNPPKNVKTWADFQYRRDEVNALKRQL